MEGSCWCQMDGANGMLRQLLNIGYQMEHLDPKWLGFVIYLGLRMHQFQKYRLLKIAIFSEDIIVLVRSSIFENILLPLNYFYGPKNKLGDSKMMSIIISFEKNTFMNYQSSENLHLKYLGMGKSWPRLVLWAKSKTQPWKPLWTGRS